MFFRQSNWTRVHSFKVSSVSMIDTSHENIRKLCRLVFFFLESWCCNSIECTPRIFDYAYSNWDNQWRRSFLHLYITQWFSLAHMVDLCQARSNSRRSTSTLLSLKWLSGWVIYFWFVFRTQKMSGNKKYTNNSSTKLQRPHSTPSMLM